MICNHPLTSEQKQFSQRNYYYYSAINGLSYMCLGETVLILLAVRLESPDHVISALGAMLYLGFLLLPLGKIMTARVGAARSQALFWVYRNLAALLVGCTPLLFCLGHPLPAQLLLLAGAFFFYGFRAAGVVMSQPLVGDFTDSTSLSRVLANSWGLHNTSCIIALIAISLLTALNHSIWMLTGVIAAGSLMGLTSSTFINKIDETDEIRRSARKPIWQDWCRAWRIRDFRSFLLAEFILNIAVIMVVPISMLTLKKGYGISDSQALLFALLQFTGSALISFLSGKIILKYRSRRILIASHLIFLLCCLLWLLAPRTLSPFHAGLLFLLLGGANVNISTCTTCYFLAVMPAAYRVSTSVFRSILTSAGAGLAGMLLSGSLLKHFVSPEIASLNDYRKYFFAVFLLLLAELWLIFRLKEH